MDINRCYACGCESHIHYQGMSYWVECDDCLTCSSPYPTLTQAIEEWNTTELYVKEPMKDHEFREHVNSLKDLVLTYKDTQQLRSRLAEFLKEFKENCK